MHTTRLRKRKGYDIWEESYGVQERNSSDRGAITGVIEYIDSLGCLETYIASHDILTGNQVSRHEGLTCLAISMGQQTGQRLHQPNYAAINDLGLKFVDIWRLY